MTLVPVKTPKLIKKIFSNYVWDVKGNQKVIYLTFDDGPTPEITTWTLDILQQYHAKATFFCIGNNIQKHPNIFKQILAQGHAVGNHTFNHAQGFKTQTDVYLNEVAQTQNLINLSKQNAGAFSKSKLFRPPFGKIKNSQGKALLALGYKIIMWDILSFDWKTKVTKQACLSHVITKTGSGSIVVFHDSVKASKNMQYALPKFLEFFSKKGYVFKSL